MDLEGLSPQQRNGSGGPAVALVFWLAKFVVFWLAKFVLYQRVIFARAPRAVGSRS